MLGIEPEKTIFDLVTAPGELDPEKLTGYITTHACGLDVPTLKNVRLALGTLQLLSFPQARIRVVLNRSNSKVGMKPREVEAALEQKVRWEVPSDRAVPIAVNRGAPVVISDSGSDFAKAVREMAKGVLPVEQEKKTRRLMPTLAKA